MGQHSSAHPRRAGSGTAKSPFCCLCWGQRQGEVEQGAAAAAAVWWTQVAPWPLTLQSKATLCRGWISPPQQHQKLNSLYPTLAHHQRCDSQHCSLQTHRHRCFPQNCLSWTSSLSNLGWKGPQEVTQSNLLLKAGSATRPDQYRTGWGSAVRLGGNNKQES